MFGSGDDLYIITCPESIRFKDWHIELLYDYYGTLVDPFKSFITADFLKSPCWIFSAKGPHTPPIVV